jgi:hypothetical protein
VLTLKYPLPKVEGRGDTKKFRFRRSEIEQVEAILRSPELLPGNPQLIQQSLQGLAEPLLKKRMAALFDQVPDESHQFFRDWLLLKPGRFERLLSLMDEDMPIPLLAREFDTYAAIRSPRVPLRFGHP